MTNNKLYQHRYPLSQQTQPEHQPNSNSSNSNSLVESNSNSHSHSHSDSADSDDIPLGQRHPDALKAQALIRIERAKRRQQQHQQPSETTTSTTRELARAATIAKLSMKSSTLPDEDDNQPLGLIKRMKSMAKPKPTTSTNNQTLPTQPSSAFSVEELIMKLNRVQQQALKPSVLTHHHHYQQQQQQQQHQHQPNQTKPNHTILHRRPSQLGTPQSRKYSDNILTPSLHDNPNHSHTMPIQLPSERSITKSPIEQRDLIESSRHPSAFNQQQSYINAFDFKEKHSPVLDQIRRSPTHLRGQTDQQPLHHELISNPLRRAKSIAERAGSFNPLHHPPPTVPLPTLPPLNTQPSQHHPPHPTQPQESRSPVLTRPTKLLNPIDTKVDSHLAAGSQYASPSDTCSPSVALNPRKKILIKLAIVHQSHSIMVEIDPLTSVKDLLAQAHQAGALNEEYTRGSWGVFEVWKELGIERPIREIEAIMSVINTWTSADTNEAHLLIQKNDLSGLAVSKRSFTSGRHGGNLWCELKPGKWTKKYVLLRDNELFLCSNDKGKDEMFLCTMEKFDVYAIPAWAHKTLKGVPREYSFGLKSLNKLSFFETKSDFIHKFACKDRLVLLEWIRRLYDARTYIVMSHRGEDDSTTGHLNRTKTTRTGGGGEKTKPAVGVKRSGTVAGGRAAAGVKEAMPTGPEKSGARKESTGTGGGLSRKPTLVQTGTSTKFKQGTLLGDLNPVHPPPSSKHHQLSTDDTTTLQAILPAHILALSTPLDAHLTPRENSSGLVSSGRSSSQPAANSNNPSTIPSSATASASTTSTTTIKVRTWEQMGSEERKLYLNEVQNKAKLEGRTLLQFDQNPPTTTSVSHHSHPSNSGSHLSKEPLISSVPSSIPIPPSSGTTLKAGLQRSITLGGRSSAQKSYLASTRKA